MSLWIWFSRRTREPTMGQAIRQFKSKGVLAGCRSDGALLGWKPSGNERWLFEQRLLAETQRFEPILCYRTHQVEIRSNQAAIRSNRLLFGGAESDQSKGNLERQADTYDAYQRCSWSEMLQKLIKSGGATGFVVAVGISCEKRQRYGNEASYLGQDGSSDAASHSRTGTNFSRITHRFKFAVVALQNDFCWNGTVRMRVLVFHERSGTGVH